MQSAAAALLQPTSAILSTTVCLSGSWLLQLTVIFCSFEVRSQLLQPTHAIFSPASDLGGSRCDKTPPASAGGSQRLFAVGRQSTFAVAAGFWSFEVRSQLLQVAVHFCSSNHTSSQVSLFLGTFPLLLASALHVPLSLW